MAALAAIPKEVGGAIKSIRIIHDGTNGVAVNDRIRVLDGGQFPTAPDIKAAMRWQAEEGGHFFGLIYCRF